MNCEERALGERAELLLGEPDAVRISGPFATERRPMVERVAVEDVEPTAFVDLVGTQPVPVLVVGVQVDPLRIGVEHRRPDGNEVPGEIVQLDRRRSFVGNREPVGRRIGVDRLHFGERSRFLGCAERVDVARIDAGFRHCEPIVFDALVQFRDGTGVVIVGHEQFVAEIAPEDRTAIRLAQAGLAERSERGAIGQPDYLDAPVVAFDDDGEVVDDEHLVRALKLAETGALDSDPLPVRTVSRSEDHEFVALLRRYRLNRRNATAFRPWIRAVTK
ncbi:hypothetical protein [Natrinema altunense]|uniref:hypothetical protein n=1 Tax=Natrinema altunense TaxID=222984 RepID=UPI001186A1C7|nr:hypothetical protein [Natrinema altunense]